MEADAERGKRIGSVQTSAMHQMLDRQARILERDVEADEKGITLEARMDNAQTNRDGLRAERELRRARLQAFRQSIESLQKKKMELRCAVPTRASSAPRSIHSEAGRDSLANGGGRSARSHKASVVRAVSRREAAWEQRDRALLDRLKVCVKSRIAASRRFRVQWAHADLRTLHATQLSR